MEQIPRYGGSVILEYDKRYHRYFYKGRRVVGVTSVTDVKDKSFALMPWAVGLAIKHIRTKWIPGSYLSKEEIEKILDTAFNMHKMRVKQAADIGTKAHEWIEEYVKAQINLGPQPAPSTDIAVISAIRSYVNDFEAKHSIIYRESELKVFSLEHLFAGTLDILALVDGEDELIDIKTSNDYRDIYALQTAAYVCAYNEEHGTNIRKRRVIVLPKDGGEIKEKILPPEELEEDYRAFLGLKEVYAWDLKKKGKLEIEQ